MATATYIVLIVAAAVLSLFTLVPALVFLSFAVALAWRHELRAASYALPHSLIMRG